MSDGLRVLGFGCPKPEAAVRKAQDEILAPLSEPEREQLCTLLQRLADENNALSRVPIRQAI